MKKIAIVVVNYKEYAKQFLTEFRESLLKQTYPQSKFKVYIVDNASSSESFSYLTQTHPEAEVLARPDGNYAAANNLGIRKAIEDGFNYFLVANMDTYLEKDCLHNLNKAIKHNKNSLIQAKILLYSSINKTEKIINTTGNHFHYLGFGLTGDYKAQDWEIEGYPEIGYASGCAYILNKKIFETIGGYDEKYYMYHDDMELSLKSKLAGFKAVLAPKAEIYHKYEFSRSVRMLYYMERNRFLFMFTFYTPRLLLLLTPMCLILDLGMFFYALTNGWIKTKLKVSLYFLNPKTWWYIFKKRREVAKMQKVSKREIFQEFKGKILFQEIENPILKYIANPILGLYWKLIKKII